MSTDLKKMHSLRYGLALIELAMIISIITTISMFILVTVQSAHIKTRDTRRVSDLRQI